MAAYDVVWGGKSLGEIGWVVSKVEETPPEDKRDILEIPYGDNIDITEAVAGVSYSDRVQTWTLWHIAENVNGWQEAYSELLATLNGRRERFKLSYDDAVYEGRARVVERNELGGIGFGTATVEVTCSPWRDFGETVVSVDAGAFGIDVELRAGRKPVMPTFECVVPIVLKIDGKRYDFPAGTNRTHAIWLGPNPVTANISCVFEEHTKALSVLGSEYPTLADMGELSIAQAGTIMTGERRERVTIRFGVKEL